MRPIGWGPNPVSLVFLLAPRDALGPGEGHVRTPKKATYSQGEGPQGEARTANTLLVKPLELWELNLLSHPVGVILLGHSHHGNIRGVAKDVCRGALPELTSWGRDSVNFVPSLFLSPAQLMLRSTEWSWGWKLRWLDCVSLTGILWKKKNAQGPGYQ